METPTETFDWNGTVLTFKDDIPEEAIPADFEKTTKRIQNAEAPVLDFKDGMLTVVYLADENGNNSLYVYDDKSNDIYPFVRLGNEEQYVMVLRPDDASAPTGHIPCTLSIEGKGLVNAYQINTEEFLKEGKENLFGAETVFAVEAEPTDFYLLYCLNQNGEYGWYQYDAIEGTYQRYCTALFNTAVDAKEDEDINNMIDEIEQTKQMLMFVAIVAGVVVVILLVIIIVLSRKLREYDEYEFYEDDIDDDDVEYIEKETEDDEIEVEFYEMPSEPEIPDADPDIAAFAAADIQQAETDKLTENGGPTGAGNPKIHKLGQDQQGVENNVQHRAGGDTHHSVHSAALKAQLIVQHERSGHPRRAKEDHPQIILRIRKNGVRGAQQICQRLQKDLTGNADQKAHGQKSLWQPSDWLRHSSFRPAPGR